ncbi:MAG: hypothetical protein M1833_004201 [Piccolia ochrophora]|nr:MAG: hypothetical protein M1833_004201 [Piccolia ochrophora]
MWSSNDCEKGDKRILLQAILAVVVADGLSRYNSLLAFHPTPTLSTWTLATFPTSSSYSSLLLGVGKGAAIPPPTDYPARVHKLHASFSMTGYAYSASSTTDFLATAVLSLYMLFAATHILWVLRFSRPASNHKWTSSAWATVTELLSLCINSPPTSALRGTSAGIATAATYARVAQLGVIHPSGEDQGERIVLSFDNGNDVDGGQVGGESRRGHVDNSSVPTSLEEGTLARQHHSDLEEEVRRLSSQCAKRPLISYTWPLIEERANDVNSRRRSSRFRVLVGKEYD